MRVMSSLSFGGGAAGLAHPGSMVSSIWRRVFSSVKNQSNKSLCPGDLFAHCVLSGHGVFIASIQRDGGEQEKPSKQSRASTN